MNRRPLPLRPHLVLAASLAVAAFTLVLMATDPPGPGLDPDAASYMGAARSLAWQGHYRIPSAAWWSRDSTAALTHFPPGFPTALALPIRLGMTPPQSARLIDASSAAVTVGVLVLLVATTATLAGGVLLGVALLAMPAMELVHVSVLSEPLFLTFTALLLAAMARPVRHPLAIGLAAALASLTRYAGVAFIGAGALWALAGQGTARQRVRRGVLAVLPGALLQGLWIVRTRRLHEPGGIRHAGIYGGWGPTIAQAGTTMRDWLVPDPSAWTDPMPLRGALGVAAGLLAVLVLVAGTRCALGAARSASPPAPEGSARNEAAPARLLAACALLSLSYLGMLVVSRLLADPGIPFDNRLLSPVFLLAATALATAGACWWRASAGRVARSAVALATGAWLWASALTSYGNASYLLEWGSDFAGEQWRRSELLAWGGTEGATHPLYSNWPAAVYFHLQRPARYTPVLRDTLPLAAFAESVRAHDGRVLLFTAGEPGYVATEVLRRATGLRVVAELEDGVVLAGR